MAASAYQEVLAEHRRRLARVAERVAPGRLKKLYEDGQAAVEARLHRAVRGADTFTAHLHRVVLSQLRQGEAMISSRMAGELGDLSRDAQVEAVRGLAKDVTRLQRHFGGAEVALPIEEAARFAGVVGRHRASLMRLHRESMARYGATVVQKMEDRLALGLVTEESPDETVAGLADAANLEWWRAERIARTEIAGAFNQTHRDAIAEAADAVPDLMSRWTENVSDDGAPLDDRVGDDSIAMHGQVAPPGGVFTMPQAERVSPSLWLRSWNFPPNRPNDRAVLTPWRKDWGAPGWRFVGGARVDL